MYKLRKFKNMSDYQTFRWGGEYKPPCVSYVTDSDIVEYGHIPQKAGDIAYWDGQKVKVCSYDLWDSSLGTPVGVVVIPKGFVPDGRTRIISMYSANMDGSSIAEEVLMNYGPKGVDTPLENYDGGPTTDNKGSTTTGYAYINSSGAYLPSDNESFTNDISYVDKLVRYASANSGVRIPSPYICDAKGNEKPNPEYYKEVIGNKNVFSDFNGKENTYVLKNLSADYQAANACWNYSDSVSNLQWYLPSMGELGYFMARFNKIMYGLMKIGGFTLGTTCLTNGIVSSNEYDANNMFYLIPQGGKISAHNKLYNNRYARPFAKLP